MRGKVSSWSRRFTLAVVAGVVAATPFTASVAAAPNDQAATLTVSKAQEQVLDQQISDQLKLAPGGERISVNQVAWNGPTGKPVVMTFPVPGEKTARATGEPVTALGTPNCSYEYICLWDYLNFEGRRLTFSACTTVYLGNYGFAYQVESWQNNQTPNTKSWLVENGSILMDMIPNSKVSHVGVYNINRATHVTVC